MFGLSRKTECDKIRGKLSEYIDKRLDAVQQERVEAHLRGCQACRTELESLQSTVNLLHRVTLVPVPHSFTLAEAEPARRRIALNVLRGATAFAALALTILLLGDLFSFFGGVAPLGREALPASAPTLAESRDQQLSAADETRGAPTEEIGGALEKAPTSKYGEGAVQTPAAGVLQPDLTPVPEVAAEEKEATEREFGLGSWAGGRIVGPLRGIHVVLLGVVAVLGGITAFISRRQRSGAGDREGRRIKNA